MVSGLGIFRSMEKVLRKGSLLFRTYPFCSLLLTKHIFGNFKSISMSSSILANYFRSSHLWLLSLVILMTKPNLFVFSKPGSFQKLSFFRIIAHGNLMIFLTDWSSWSSSFSLHISLDLSNLEMLMSCWENWENVWFKSSKHVLNVLKLKYPHEVTCCFLQDRIFFMF